MKLCAVGFATFKLYAIRAKKGETSSEHFVLIASRPVAVVLAKMVESLV